VDVTEIALDLQPCGQFDTETSPTGCPEGAAAELDDIVERIAGS
jgi:hypothetical protein